MNSQEAFRRLANQLRSTSGGGSPLPGGKKGFFAGSGLLIALIGGGLALNASLFNGAFNSSTFHLMYTESLL
jgi:prohibitin 2